MTESDLALVPRPSLLSLTGGTFSVPHRFNVAESGCADDRDFIYKMLTTASLITFKPTGDAPATLLVTMDPSFGADDEAYALDVTTESILITASGKAGLFYAAQTLRQLLDPARREVPCLHIEDAPRFKWRGMHLDVSRHFFDGAFVRRYIDLLAQHKLNVFHWHLTDDDGWRLELDAYPELTERGGWRGENEALPPSYGTGNERYGGYYTKDEVRDIIAYAADRHVTVVPEIDVPGHCKPVTVCHPHLLCEGDMAHMKSVQEVAQNLLCAGREETFEFLETVIGEVAELFPSPYIHMGGDERPEGPWEQCPLCAGRIRTEGLANTDQLQGYFMERVRKLVEARGKKMIGWNEITHGDIVSTSAIVMAWQDPEKGAEAACKGHPVIMAPARHTYFDLSQAEHSDEPGLRWAGILPLKKAYSWSPLPDATAEKTRERILGVHGCLWSETLIDDQRAEYMAFPRLCALAEVAWTPANLQRWPNFLERLTIGHLARLKAQRIGYRPLDQIPPAQ
jgi:hexosaminidase